jgi:hypothetical protein
MWIVSIILLFPLLLVCFEEDEELRVPFLIPVFRKQSIDHCGICPSGNILLCGGTEPLLDGDDFNVVPATYFLKGNGQSFDCPILYLFFTYFRLPHHNDLGLLKDAVPVVSSLDTLW